MRAGGEATGFARQIGGEWLSGVGGDGDVGVQACARGKKRDPIWVRHQERAGGTAGGSGCRSINVRSSPYFRPKPSVFCVDPLFCFLRLSRCKGPFDPFILNDLKFT